MAKSREAFRQELEELLDELRPYGLSYYHPLLNGQVQTRQQVEEWCRNFYIRDVSVLLPRTYAKCPHQEARRQTPLARARWDAQAKEDWLEAFAGFCLGAEYYSASVFSLIADRLHGEFGIPKDALEFFYTHLQEDEGHSRRTMEIVVRYATTDEDQERVTTAIRRHILGDQAIVGGPAEATALPTDVVRALRSRVKAPVS